MLEHLQLTCCLTSKECNQFDHLSPYTESDCNFSCLVILNSVDILRLGPRTNSVILCGTLYLEFVVLSSKKSVLICECVLDLDKLTTQTSP